MNTKHMSMMPSTIAHPKARQRFFCSLLSAIACCSLLVCTFLHLGGRIPIPIDFTSENGTKSRIFSSSLERRRLALPHPHLPRVPPLIIPPVVGNNRSDANNYDTDFPPFPPASEVLEMVNLSFLMYTLKDKVTYCDDGIDIFQRVLPKDTTCLLYSHDTEQGTQVLVVRSTSRNYIGVVYAGTDDLATALSDGDILLSHFGSRDGSGADDENSDGNSIFGSSQNNIPSDVRVHRGFNNAVFANGGYDSVLDVVRSAMVGDNENYRLITTGHSLGAADSVITAVALHLTYPERLITSINFGCPKIGNYAWFQWLRSLAPSSNSAVKRGEGMGSDGVKSNAGPLGGVNVFRFVNGRDMVPRLPEYPFRHAGHTIQIDREDGSCCLAYFHHDGDETLGYAGVPRGWDFTPLVWLPGAFEAHRSNYVKFLTKDYPDSDASYFQDFVKTDEFLTSR